nr:NBS-containing resistance-like protein [Tanacetum cinerariifolium]
MTSIQVEKLKPPIHTLENQQGGRKQSCIEKSKERELDVIQESHFFFVAAKETNSRRFFVPVRAEAEYRGVAETCWIRNLLRKLHTPLSSATIVYCDNVSVVYLSSNPVQHQRTKHIEIDIHFVRDLVATGQVRVLHVPSLFQYADIFTKGLPSALFDEFRDSLNVRCTSAPTAGEY